MSDIQNHYFLQRVADQLQSNGQAAIVKSAGKR
jgi:hypothetical protein